MSEEGRGGGVWVGGESLLGREGRARIGAGRRRRVQVRVSAGRSPALLTHSTVPSLTVINKSVAEEVSAVQPRRREALLRTAASVCLKSPVPVKKPSSQEGKSLLLPESWDFLPSLMQGSRVCIMPHVMCVGSERYRCCLYV